VFRGLLALSKHRLVDDLRRMMLGQEATRSLAVASAQIVRSAGELEEAFSRAAAAAATAASRSRIMALATGLATAVTLAALVKTLLGG
jgi:hypothetical protein